MEKRFEVSNLPAEVSVWTKIKNFLFHEVKLELTPKQEKVFKEVRDFWTQEIYFDGGFHLRPYSYRKENSEDVEVTL